MPDSDDAAARAARAGEKLAAFPGQIAAAIVAALQELRGTPTPDGDSGTVLPGGVSRLCEAVGSVAIGLDLLHVMRGEAPRVGSHTRAVVGATLRVKRRRLGRAPASADWPTLHPVPLFACAYWGGVERWADGVGERAQQPKRFWGNRANRIAAMRRFKAKHPGLPVTTGTLGSHGLAALARSLTAAELKTLCVEAGCGRDLARRPAGCWTEARVIDRYAALCRDAGITLSGTR